MSESSEAKRDGARLQKNSGRGAHKKADAIQDDLSVDYKEHSKSFSINRKGWAKVCTDAAKNGADYVPVLKIILGEGMRRIRLAIIGWDYFMYLKDVEQRYNEMTGEDNG